VDPPKEMPNPKDPPKNAPVKQRESTQEPPKAPLAGSAARRLPPVVPLGTDPISSPKLSTSRNPY
jgi:hypothetical protein